MTDGHSSAAVFYRKKNENVTGHPDDDLEYMFWQTVTVTLCHLSVEPLICSREHSFTNACHVKCPLMRLCVLGLSECNRPCSQ